MDRKWTEGPWTKATAEDIEGALITNCFMHQRSIFVGYTLQASRLYAAAPALYEALERADHTLSVHGHIDADTPLHETIRAALNKALGNTQET